MGPWTLIIPLVFLVWKMERDVSVESVAGIQPTAWIYCCSVRFCFCPYLLFPLAFCSLLACVPWKVPLEELWPLGWLGPAVTWTHLHSRSESRSSQFPLIKYTSLPHFQVFVLLWYKFVQGNIGICLYCVFTERSLQRGKKRKKRRYWNLFFNSSVMYRTKL